MRRARPLAAAAAIAAALSSLALIEREPERPGPTRCALAPVTTVSAMLPAIGDLARFDVSDADPFMPSAVRQAARGHRDPGPGDGATVTRLDPRPADPKPPALALPAAIRPTATAFSCLGVVAARGGQALLVRLSDGATAAVRVGEAVPAGEAGARWVLEALEPGGVARFRDGVGAAQRLAVGGQARVAGAGASEGRL